MATEATGVNTHTVIPFVLAGRQGRVSVTYGPNTDACQAGFDALPGLSFPIELCLGYPVMYARIENFDGTGYRMICGWIQVVMRECLADADAGWDQAERSSSVDLPPTLSETGVPFAVQGPLPVLFDAPCMNLGNCAALRWTANSFLTTLPLRSREEEITPLLGFRWGYYEYAPSLGRKVVLLPLEVTDGSTWASHLPLLRREFPTWRYGERRM